MPIQNTDLLLVNRAGTDYKVASSNVMAKVQGTDVLLVHRAGVDYKITGAKLLAGTFLDTDLFLVNRAGVDYKATGALVRAILSRAPIIATTVLSEVAAGGAAFTSQSFRTAWTMTDEGSPVSTKALKAYVESRGAGGTRLYLVFNGAGAVIDMQSADPGFVPLTNQASPATLTFPAIFPSGNTPDVELPTGTTITTVLRAVNVAGIATQTSNTVTPARISVPGDTLGGGFFVGQIRLLQGQHNFDTGQAYAEDTMYNVILAPRATGQNGGNTAAGIQYKTANTSDAPAAISQLLNDGRYITSTFNNTAHPAFAWASGLTIGGHSDWYIPARDELEIIYRAFKPTTTANTELTGRKTQNGPATDSSTDDPNTGHGINLNSVPAGVAYTALNPQQTSLPAYQTGGTEAMSATGGYYMTATEYSTTPSQNWRHIFGNGSQHETPSKNANAFARAVRRELA